MRTSILLLSSKENITRAVMANNHDDKKLAPHRGVTSYNILIKGVVKISLAGIGGLAASKIKNAAFRNTASVVCTTILIDGALTALTAYAHQKLSVKAVPEIRKKAVVDGIEMQWEEHGDLSDDALPVIFVHGIPSHPRAWRYVIPLVSAPGVRCLAWELVGYGWSIPEGLNRHISPAKQMEYLKKWLQYMNIDRAVFVGHDVGGGAIQALLVDEPERALGLILSDAVAYDNWPVPMVKACRSLANIIEYLPAFLVKPFYCAALLNLGHDHILNLLDAAWIHWQPYKYTDAGKGLAQQARYANEFDTIRTAQKLHTLAKLTFPKTVIWGTKDPLGVDSAERLAKDIDANLQLIPGGKHFTLENHPEIIAKAINGMISIVSMRKNAGVTSVSQDKIVDEG